MIPTPRQVYAIRYATRAESFRAEHFYRGDPQPNRRLPIDYYVWAVLEPDRTVLLDAGFTRSTALRRGNRAFLQAPTDTLTALGAAAGSVTDVVLSHLHYDHTGYLGDFPGARIHLQRAEWEFWNGPIADRGEFPHLREDADLGLLAEAVATGRVALLDGDAAVGDGIRLHRVGGHTPGMQVMSVDTAVGTVVLASDASHFYENIGTDRPYSLVDHLPSMYSAFDLINGIASSAELIVPGHDPLVMERFPPVAGLTGLAVRVA